MEFPLSKSITIIKDGKNEQTDKLFVRDPSADEVFDFGMPFRFIDLANGGQETIIDGPCLKMWLVRLSGLDGGKLGALAPGDLQQIWTWLAQQLNPVGKNPGNSGGSSSS